MKNDNKCTGTYITLNKRWMEKNTQVSFPSTLRVITSGVLWRYGRRSSDGGARNADF